jgi:hypothetical protein
MALMAASYSVLTAAMVLLALLALLLALLLYSKSAYTASVQCTGYRYQLITDSARSGSYLFRIPIQISYGIGRIRILPVQDTRTN